MKTKFIINNKSKLSDLDAMMRIKSVIAMGKISKYNGTYGYCILSTLDDCIVGCDLTYTGTHTFTVTNL